MKKEIIRKATKPGFTIIEVSLMMAFIAALLIIIALTINSVSAIFQKGITIKSISGVGRNLISEFTSSINAAPSIDSTSLCNMYATGNTDSCLEDRANKYIFQERVGSYTYPVTGEVVNNVQYFGLLCTGRYTYAWNTYYGVEKGQVLQIQYKTSSGGSTVTLPASLANKDVIFRLVRFEDMNYNACVQNVDSNYNIKTSFTDTAAGSPIINMTELQNGVNIELAEPQNGFLESSESDVNLDLYELVFFPISQDAVTLRAFFSGTFILATNNGDVNIMRTGDYCDEALADAEETTSSILDLGSGFNYCGINKFNFAARTAGSGV